MTTIAVSRKNGILAIGADTRAKHGYTNISSKYRLDKSKILRIPDTLLM